MANNKKDLTKGNLSRNLVRLAIPIILTNLMHVLYNMTDMYWLGKLETGASGAVAVTGNAGSLVWLISSFSGGFMVSGTALLSRYTGSGRKNDVKRVIAQMFLIMGGFSLIFLAISFWGTGPLLRLLNVPDEIFTNAQTYLSIIIPGMACMFIFNLYQCISHAQGDSISPMKVQLAAVLFNVVVDPILIFGLAGLPAMGVKGAGVATLSARIISMSLGAWLLLRRNRDVLPSLSQIRPDFPLLKKITRIGVPAGISGSMTAFGFVLLQAFVNSYGVTVITVYQISNQFIGVFLIPSMGINNALTNIVGQNLGAGKVDRAEKSIALAMKLVLLIMGIGTAILFFFGGEITTLIIDSPEVVEISRPMFRIMSVSALICSAMFIHMSAFSGAGRTFETMIVHAVRLWCFRLPLAYIFAGYFINQKIIKSGPIYDLLVFLAKPFQAASYEALWWSSLLSNVVGFTWMFFLFQSGKWKVVAAADESEPSDKPPEEDQANQTATESTN